MAFDNDNYAGWGTNEKMVMQVFNDMPSKSMYTKVQKEYANIPEIECLPSQLNQVFMNMMVNAGHAMETKGILTLRTGTEGEMVWVEVADNGKGIPPEIVQRIFDPFFTTKPVGTGTGLGLSLSLGIINKHHGRIEVNSELGKGSAFRIWLPIKHASVRPEAAPVLPA